MFLNFWKITDGTETHGWSQDSILFKKCLKWGPEWTCEGTKKETYRMLLGAEFIENTAEGPHITSKHRHITING